MQDVGGASTRRQRLRMSPPRSAQAYGARRDLPNRVMTRKSRTQQSFASTSLKYYSYQTDTFIGNNIQLSTSIGLLLLYLSFHHTTLFMGECWSYKQIVVVYLPTYISMHRTRVEF